jgi:uncharacterized protein
MAALVRRVSVAVTARPWTILVALTAITVLLGFFAAQQQQTDDAGAATGRAADAAAVIEERFGTDTATVQVLLTTEGRDVVNAGSWQAVAAMTEAVQRSGASARVEGFDDGAPFLSFLTPAMLAAEAVSGGVGAVDDATVRALQEQGLDLAPPEIAERTRALVSDAQDPPESGLILVALDTAGLDEEAELALQRDLAAAVARLDLPDGVTLEPFSFALLLDSDIGGDIARLFGLAFAIILAVLAVVYWVRPAEGQRWITARRTAADVAITLTAVVLAIGWMQGIGVLLGPDHLGLIGYFAPQTQVVPILIVGLGVDYAIHLTDRYREEVGDGAATAPGFHRASATVGVALVLASVTTAIGFLTNLLSPIQSLATLGVLAAVGIVAALVMTLTFVPAVRVILDRRAEDRGTLPRESLGNQSEEWLARIGGRTSVLAIRLPFVTIGVAVVLAAGGVWGFTRLDTRFDFTDFVPQDSPRLDTLETIQAEFGGGFGPRTDVLLVGDVATSEAHNALVEALAALTEVEAVAVVAGRPDADSPVSVLRSALTADPDVRAAAERAGVTEDLRVAPGADVRHLYSTLLERVPEPAGQVLSRSGDGFSARVSLRTANATGGAGELADEVRRAFAPLEEAAVTAVPTSDDIIGAELSDEIQRSQLTSMALALGAAALLLTAYYGRTARRPMLGAVTVVPVALVIAWTFGAMNLTGIPLTPVTATIAALAIGIGIDFAIHIANRFLEVREQGCSIEQAVSRTASSTGAALIGSAVTTLAGFGVLVTSDLVPFRQLGAVTAYAIGFSLLAAVLVFPSILAVTEARTSGEG